MNTYEIEGDSHYPEILDAVAYHFGLNEFEKICLHQDWDPQNDSIEVTHDFSEGSIFEKANDFYTYLVFNKILADVDVFDRLFTLLTLDRAGINKTDRLTLMAFTASLNPYETVTRDIIRGTRTEMEEHPQKTKMLAMMYALDFVLTGTSWGDTYCIKLEEPEECIIPRLRRTEDSEIIDEVNALLEYLKPYAEMIDLDIEDYPDQLLE